MILRKWLNYCIQNSTFKNRFQKFSSKKPSFMNQILTKKSHTLQSKNHHSDSFPSKHLSWWRCLEDVLKTPFVFVFRKCLQDVTNTPWSRTIDSSWSYVFKTFSRRIQDVFRRLAKKSSRHFQDVLPTHFSEIYGQCAKFARAKKFFQILVFNFTTPFSGCLQRRIWNLVRHIQWSFFERL